MPIVAHRRVRPSMGRDCDQDITTASGCGRRRVCGMTLAFGTAPRPACL